MLYLRSRRVPGRKKRCSRAYDLPSNASLRAMTTAGCVDCYCATVRSTKVASESRGPSRINYAVVYPAIVVLGVLTGVLGTVLFPMDWGPDDWISLSVGVFTTMAVAVVAQRQDAIRGATEMKRKSSEDAFASLDFQEKLGVIEANAYRTAGMDPDWCMYVASDARAAMYVFEYVDADQQSNYLSAVGAAFRSMQTAKLS